MMDSCIFCKIIKGEIPSLKVYEDQSIIAFLDIAPANRGHVLVVPKMHLEMFHELSSDLTNKSMEVIKKIAQAQSHALGNIGYNVLVNNAKVAGQVVPHVHVHVIPRFENDGLQFNWRPKPSINGEMEKLKNTIAKFL